MSPCLKHFRVYSFLPLFLIFLSTGLQAASTVSINGRTFTCESGMVCNNGNCSCTNGSGGIVVNGNGSVDIGTQAVAPTGYRRHKNGGGLVALTARVEDSVYVGPNSTVEGTSDIVGVTHVGPNSKVENSRIVNSDIGPNSKIADSSLSGTRVGPNSTIERMELIQQTLGPNSTLKGQQRMQR